MENTPQSRTRFLPRINWKVALIVAAVLTCVGFFLELVSEQLVTDEAIRVIVVAGAFFLASAMAVAYSRARGEKPKWFVYTIWALLLVSDDVFSYVNDAGTTYTSQFAIATYAQAALWLLAGVGLLVFLLGNAGVLKGIFTGPYRVISALAVVCLCSVVLSPQVSFSTAWAFKLVLTVTLLHVCFRQMDGMDDITAFLLASAAAYLFIVGAPAIRSLLPDPNSDYGANEFETRLREGPTGISAAAGTLAMLGLTLYNPKRKWMMAVAVAGLAVMIIAGGKAGIASGFIAGIVFFMQQKRFGAVLGFVGGMIGILILALLFTPLSSYMVAYTSSGQATSLTGRTELWSFVWPTVRNNLLLGHGYVASRFVSVLMPDTPFKAGHMHNGFLETLYNNGLVGLGLMLSFHFYLVRNLWRALKSDLPPATYRLAIGCLALYVNLFLNGMFNATFGGRVGPAYMMMIAVFMLSVRVAQEAEKPVMRSMAFSASAV